MCSKLRRYVLRLKKKFENDRFVSKTCTKIKISWVLLAEFMLTSITLFCIMYYTIKPAMIAD